MDVTAELTRLSGLQQLQAIWQLEDAHLTDPPSINAPTSFLLAPAHRLFLFVFADDVVAPPGIKDTQKAASPTKASMRSNLCRR
jgi:hypothetical protein